VLIEAMACGIPSIGSSADGSREAMLNGRLGPVIDPCRPQQIVDAVRDSIRQPRRVPAELAYFSLEQFERRVSDALTRLSVRTQAATPA
jgi:phosphatidyl-myo-inositol dimannoside synthase